jgi:multiple sugar transport system ATP-binding protein
MAQVVLESVSKKYTDGTVAVDDLSLCVHDREFLVLVGPSGCGKSTTLRLIAGLERPTTGSIRIGDRMVNEIAPKDRDIAMVFQNYALYPHMSVYRNLAFGLELRYGGSFVARVLRRWLNPRRAAELAKLRRGIDGQVRQAARRLNIDALLDRKPHQLSGGERQRVALGRAIVRNPAAFLFDEPLSNLDAKLRQQMRVDLKQLHMSLAATMIYVTHDQIEAMTLGHRVAVMDRGRLQQVAEPSVVYRQPANIFVARFFGSTPINLVTGRLKTDESGWIFESDGWQWHLEGKPFEDAHARAGRNAAVTLGFRAEDVRIAKVRSGDLRAFSGSSEVLSIDQWGDVTVVHVSVPGSGNLPAASVNAPKGHPSDSDHWTVKLPNDVDVSVGQRLLLTVMRDRCLWFDPESGRNLNI